MARTSLLPIALACCGPLWLGAGAGFAAGGGSTEPVDAGARRVQGRVLDAEGWPLPGARVYVLRDGVTTGPPLLETTTDADGRFSLDSLEPGTYRIDIEARGHQLAHVGAHLLEGTTPFAPLEVHMRPQTTSRPAPDRPPSPASTGGVVAASASTGAAVATPSAPAPRPAPPLPTAEPPTSGVDRLHDAPGGDTEDVRTQLQRALEAGQIPRAQSIVGGIQGHHAEDADLFYAVGEALLRAGEAEAALHTLDEALSRDPAHVEARYRRALTLLALGRRDEARDAFSRVLELRPAGPLADGARQALAALAPAGSSR